MLNKIKCFPWPTKVKVKLQEKERDAKINIGGGLETKKQIQSEVRNKKPHDAWICLSTTRGFSLEADIQRI